MVRENYCPENTISVQNWTAIPKENKLQIQTPSQYRFCQDEEDLVSAGLKGVGSLADIGKKLTEALPGGDAKLQLAG